MTHNEDHNDLTGFANGMLVHRGDTEDTHVYNFDSTAPASVTFTPYELPDAAMGMTAFKYASDRPEIIFTLVAKDDDEEQTVPTMVLPGFLTHGEEERQPVLLQIVLDNIDNIRSVVTSVLGMVLTDRQINQVHMLIGHLLQERTAARENTVLEDSIYQSMKMSNPELTLVKTDPENPQAAADLMSALSQLLKLPEDQIMPPETPSDLS